MVTSLYVRMTISGNDHTPAHGTLALAAPFDPAAAPALPPPFPSFGAAAAAASPLLNGEDDDADDADGAADDDEYESSGRGSSKRTEDRANCPFSNAVSIAPAHSSSSISARASSTSIDVKAGVATAARRRCAVDSCHADRSCACWAIVPESKIEIQCELRCQDSVCNFSFLIVHISLH